MVIGFYLKHSILYKAYRKMLLSQNDINIYV
jgi:hypothetical protein